MSNKKKTVGCATYEETLFYIEDFIDVFAELKKKYTGEKEDERVHSTADVVEVVRCKDCIHRDPEDKKCDCSFQAKGGMFPMDDNDFCSYGERKKECKECPEN